MKGIILAGGHGSRLMPITHFINKNLLPIYNKPGIFYSIELLRDSGIEDICIVAENNYINDFKNILGNGTDFRVNLHYENDTPIKKGPASAAYYAKNYVGNDNVVVVFADGNFDINIKSYIKNFTDGAIIFVKEVDDPTKFGVAEIGKNGEVLSIQEKPKFPKSNYACTGMGIYDSNLFKYIDMIKPGIKGEYYMTDVDKIYCRKHKLQAKIIKGFWQDIGTFDGMLKASNYWSKKNLQNNPSI